MPPLVGFGDMVGGVSGPGPGGSDGKARSSPDWCSGAAPSRCSPWSGTGAMPDRAAGGLAGSLGAGAAPSREAIGWATNRAGVIAAAGRVALSGFDRGAGRDGLWAASDISTAGVGGGSVTARRRTALSPVKGRAVGAPGLAGPITAGPKVWDCSLPGDPVAPGSTGSVSTPAQLGV